MRFGLKCLVTLAILYRAILVSQSGSQTAALPLDLRTAASATQAKVRDGIASLLGAYCRSDPASCLSKAARLPGLIAAGGPLAEPRQHRHGAIAAATR